MPRGQYDRAAAAARRAATAKPKAKRRRTRIEKVSLDLEALDRSEEKPPEKARLVIVVEFDDATMLQTAADEASFAEWSGNIVSLRGENMPRVVIYR